MQVTKEMRTETGHRLTNYDGRCSHLHGHSYRWCVTAKCANIQLDEKNMVMDFKDLKKAMNAVLDPLDHCMVLAHDDPLWNTAVKMYEEISDSLGRDIVDNIEKEPLHGMLQATNKADPRLIKWPENPTAESFAQWALKEIHAELQRLWEAKLCDAHKGAAMPYFISSVKVWETATSCAEAQSGEG